MPNLLLDLEEGALEEERTRLTRYCHRFVSDDDIAEDLAQETLLEALRHGDKLRDPAVWRSWLKGIARNVCLRYIKERSKERERRFLGEPTSVFADQLAGEDSDPLEVLEQNERGKLLDRAMDFLPSHSRELLVRRYVEDLPVSEISAAFGLTENHLNVRLHRSRLALRDVLYSEPFREEMSAYGLRTDTPEEDDWQQTNIWCPRCGEHKLQGKSTIGSASPYFAVRCPGCRDMLGADFSSNHPQFDTERILGSLKGFKPALTRLHNWWYEREEEAVNNRRMICHNCKKPAEVLFRTPPCAPAHLRDILQFYLFCPNCRRTGGPTVLGRSVVNPEVQRFWRRHSRMRGQVVEELRLDNGAMATLTRFESLTSSAKIELLYANDDASLLEIQVTDPIDAEK